MLHRTRQPADIICASGRAWARRVHEILTGRSVAWPRLYRCWLRAGLDDRGRGFLFYHAAITQFPTPLENFGDCIHNLRLRGVVPLPEDIKENTDWEAVRERLFLLPDDAREDEIRKCLDAGNTNRERDAE